MKLSQADLFLSEPYIRVGEMPTMTKAPTLSEVMLMVLSLFSMCALVHRLFKRRGRLTSNASLFLLFGCIGTLIMILMGTFLMRESYVLSDRLNQKSMYPTIASPSGANRVHFTDIINTSTALHGLLSCKHDRGIRYPGKMLSGSPVIVFIHVFKTGGSTVRNFFRDLARTCSLGWLCIVHAGAGKRLSAKDAISRSGSTFRCDNVLGLGSGLGYEKGCALDLHWAESQVDIAGGHMRFGFGNIWTYSGSHRPVAYIGFIRDAFDLFVSRSIYIEHFATVKAAADSIKSWVLSERASGNYRMGYSKYFLTHEEFEATLMNANEYARAAKRNLNTFAVVGVVSRWPQTMSLIQAAVDPLNQARSLFEAWAGAQDQRNAKRKNVHRGGVTTAMTKAALKLDQSFWPTLVEYLKYDIDVTNHGVALHMGQHELMLKRAKTRRTQP